MLIGLSGKKRVGKDTVGHWLEVKHDFTRVSFATKLKEIARRCGWNGKKDEKGRRFLQDLGMVIRTYDENFFVDEAFREITKVHNKTGAENFVITDSRFRNEALRVKAAGGIMLRVTRQDEISDDLHISETDLDKYEFDYTVESVFGDLNDLYGKVDAIVVQELTKSNVEVTT